MTKLKYPKDSKGNSILGEKYGIQITRPWNNAMYKHNNKIAELMKENIKAAIETYDGDMNDIARHVTGYTFAYSCDEDIREELLNELDRLQNFWLYQEYPYLVKKGICEAIEIEMIGY